jgi:hypothetical protein
LDPTTTPLPKFEDHLHNCFGNGIISVNGLLIDFSNACNNIGENENGTCMCLFFNSLEGKDVAEFFELTPKYFSTWDEFSYWFKSTYGQPQSPIDQIKEYNNIVYNKGETVKYFNLCFTKLYNKIPEIIRPHNQSTLMHYYNTLLVYYRHRIEEKNVDSLGSVTITHSHNIVHKIYLRNP